MTGPDWPAAYAGAAALAAAGAATAAPLLAGFNTCVDQLYRLDGPALDAFAAAARGDGAVAGFAAEVLRRIAWARDGELLEPARDEVEPWLTGTLGEPAGAQVGGTGAQACWTLAELGAPAVLALADRGPRQLAVLHPAIGLCDAAGLATVARAVPAGGAGKPPHYILEFTAGTRWSGGVVPRSSRIIARFADDGVELDRFFAAATPVLAPRAGAGLVSGLNSVPDSDTAARAWVRDVAAGWRAAGLDRVHLELAEYPRPGAVRELLDEYAGTVRSLGLSASELAALDGDRDPVDGALRLAAGVRVERVVVHADTWSLAVHRGDPAAAATALTLGNLLAAARAAAGRPAARPEVAPDAAFAADLPRAGELGGGWRSTRVPSPYLARPAATIGLGDTFVAGLLLADCLAAAPSRPAVSTTSNWSDQ